MEKNKKKKNYEKKHPQRAFVKSRKKKTPGDHTQSSRLSIYFTVRGGKFFKKQKKRVFDLFSIF